MLEVWVAPIGKLDPDALIWENKVSKERWQASRNIKKVEARARSLGAELLLNHALKAFLSPEAFPVRYFQDEKGKKYLANAFCHFNLSHSGEYVACVLSDQPVGIDIQQCRNVQLDVARRFLAVSEQQALLEKREEEQKEFFF